MLAKRTTRNTNFLYFSLFCIYFSVSFSPVNPTYILGCGLILVLFMQILLRMRIQRFTLITIIFAMMFLFEQLIGINIVSFYPEGPVYLTPLLFSYSILISACVIEGFQGLKSDFRLIIYKRVYNSAIIFLLIELITRILNYNKENNGFYSFKYSILYFDSNFTGLVILSLCSFLFYLKYVKGNDLKIQRRILYFLLFATFSRGAIAALILTRIGLGSKKRIRSKAFLIIAVAVIIFSILTIEYIEQSQSYSSIDGSFNSKFYIISQALSFYDSLPTLVHWFGIGMGNTSQFIGIFAHNIFVTMILEMGMVGTILFLLYVFYTLKLSNGYALFIWVPIFVGGISLFSAFSPFAFIICALICCENMVDKKYEI